MDEAILSLQEAILLTTSFDECVFWCGEIYYSGHGDVLWEFIFEFYYNFCAVTHPKYERKLSKLKKQGKLKKLKKQGKLKNQGIEDHMSAITLLFHSKKNYDVFTHWFTTPPIPNKIYIGRNPKWYKSLEIDKKYKNFIRSVHSENWTNVVFYLKYLDPKIAYTVVKEYFTKVHNMTLKERALDNVPYRNKGHIVFALIKHLFMDSKNIQKICINIVYDHTRYNEKIDDDNESVSPAYKTLVTKLRYPISKKIGCFPLQRHAVDIKDAYRNHWEYYAYKSPLWKERFDECKITIDDEKRGISFMDAEEYDDFCEKYYYEPDEQGASTQNKNIGNIEVVSLEKWFENKN